MFRHVLELLERRLNPTPLRCNGIAHPSYCPKVHYAPTSDLKIARFTSAVERKVTQLADLIRNSLFELCSATSLRVESASISLDDDADVQMADSILSFSKQCNVRLTVYPIVYTDRQATVLRSNRGGQT